MGSSRNFGRELNIFRLVTEVDTQQWRAEGGGRTGRQPRASNSRVESKERNYKNLNSAAR